MQSSQLIVNDNSHLYCVEKQGLQQWLLPQLEWNIAFKENIKEEIESLEQKLEYDGQISRNKYILCLENATFDGQVLKIQFLDRLLQFKQQYGKRVHFHLDGARIFDALTHYNNANFFNNQQIQLNKDSLKKQMGNEYFERLIGIFDTISICFSKGLCCPMGSVLLGSDGDLIEKAFTYRKHLGGATRQAGYMAGMCMQALEEKVPQLKIPHQLSLSCYNQLEQMNKKKQQRKIILLPIKPEINMIFFGIEGMKGSEVQNYLKSQWGILVKPYKQNTLVRACFSLNHTEESVLCLVAAVEQMIQEQ